MKVGILLPEVVELELEAHWRRQFEDKCSRCSSAADAANKHLLDPAAVCVTLPPEEQALAGYRRIVQSIKDQWKITICPLASPPVSDLVTMSIQRQPPFKDKDSGLRDAVILFSVLEHLRNPPEAVGAFASQDEIFRRPEVAALTSSRGVRVEFFPGLKEILQALENRIDEIVRKAWEYDRALAAAALETMIPQIAKFVSEHLEIPHWKMDLGGRLVSISSIEDLRIKQVRTPFLLERPQKDPLKLSFSVEFGLRCIVDRYEFPARRGVRVGETMPVPELGMLAAALQGPRQEERVVPFSATVEAVAELVDGKYTNIELTSVQPGGAGGFERLVDLVGPIFSRE
jgi:hypothetical protein